MAISTKRPTISDEDFDRLVTGTPSDADPSPSDDAFPPPSHPARQQAPRRGRPKKNVDRPWEAEANTGMVRSSLILEAADKARLDYIAQQQDRPIQRILRNFLEPIIRQEAESLFRQQYPEAPPPRDEDEI